MNEYKVTILGAGLAGCEAALWLAGKGVQIELYEQKPVHFSPAHKSEGFAELICSNSLKAERLDSASGLLKEEMRRMGSRLPMRRISSFSRPEAESSRSAFRLLEQISSAKPSLLWAGEKWTGFCSYSSTCTPLPASQRAASQPARPAPRMVTLYSFIRLFFL